MRSCLSLIIVSAIVLVLGSAAAENPKKPAPDKPNPKAAQAKLMADKLKAAQKLLDGLATNDFEKIAKSAEDLMIISRAAEFTASGKTPPYELHTNSFRRALETISQKSKDKNLDGATLGYLDMTLTCVKCHQHTREVRNASLSLPMSDVELGQ